MDMLNQQNRVVEEQAKAAAVKKVAETTDLTTNQTNTTLDTKANTSYFDFGEINTESDKLHDSTIEEIQRREIEMTNRKLKNRRAVNEVLGTVSDVTGAIAGGLAHIGTSTALSATGGFFNGASNYFTGTSSSIGQYGFWCVFSPYC